MLARGFGASPAALADGVAPAVASGLVLMRIGCFLNGCCPGETTSLCCAVALWVRGRGALAGVRPGTAALTFATGFLAFRVLNGAIRPDAPGATLPHELLLAGYAVAAVAAGLLLAAWVRPGGPARARARRPVAVPVDPR